MRHNWIFKGSYKHTFKYPVMPMFSLLFNLSLIIYFMYKLFHKSIDKVSTKYKNSIDTIFLNVLLIFRNLELELKLIQKL